MGCEGIFRKKSAKIFFFDKIEIFIFALWKKELFKKQREVICKEQ